MALVLFIHLLAVLTLVAGKPILIPRLAQEASQDDAQTLFDVTLEFLGNTSVKADITNVGAQGLRLVQRGGILDHVPTKKVIVKGGDSDPVFTGVRVEYIPSHLTADGFVKVSPKQTISVIFDTADIYALTPGQEYTAVADGVLGYTTLTEEKKFHHYEYKSNSITFTAPDNVQNRLEDRSTLVCSDEYNQIVQDAIARAAEMATAAAADARQGSALFEKFFKSNSKADREEVAGRLEAIATEATTKGELTYYCEPTSQDYCSANVAAMTYPTLNRVVNCPGYYSSTKVSNYCNYLDQAGITLHEYSHADALYSPGTEDIVYGYDGVLSLNTKRAKDNADSFAYYASAVYLQCAADDSVTIGTPITDTGDDSSTDTDTGSGTDTTDDATPTTTTEPTNPPQPTTTTTTSPPTQAPTDTPGTGWDWPWGAGGGHGWGDHDHDHDHDGDGDGDDQTGTFPGTGMGIWPGWGWGWGEPPTSSGPTNPVTTSSGEDLFNLQDLLDWLMSKYTGQAQGSSSSFGNGAHGTQTTPGEEDCDQ
ncbi:Deuterolysin metalloprotease family-domain-containing protein [Aspergillus lucknowensis]|uniref:Neutral protease 2 n=1 Tax=Aspergillus lucknowensis TaxID=176173 RepID=A0ABR4M347_9EURO